MTTTPESDTPIFDELYAEWAGKLARSSASSVPAPTPSTATTTPRPGQKPVRSKRKTR